MASTLSSQYDSVLLGEKRSKIVFNLFAKTEGFKLGLCNGLYLYFPPKLITIKSSSLPHDLANSETLI